MIEQTDVAVTTVLGWVRDLSIPAAVLLFGWKTRGLYQEVIDFKNEIVNFMDDMRQFTQRAETNHLTHIEGYLKTISRSRGPYSQRVYESVDSVETVAEAAPPESDNAVQE